jgi:hypothetical protein
VAGLPGKGMISHDALSCTVTYASEDVMKKSFFLNIMVMAGRYLPAFFGGAGYALCR